MSRYDPLRDHLQRQAADTVTMSFVELDSLVKLPASAKRFVFWWANDDVKTVSGIARIGERLGDEREGATRQTQHRHRSVAILYVGGLRIEDEGTPVRVDQSLALTALHLLAGIVAARPTALGGLDALAIQNRRGIL